jgi:hypothetical protein
LARSAPCVGQRAWTRILDEARRRDRGLHPPGEGGGRSRDSMHDLPNNFVEEDQSTEVDLAVVGSGVIVEQPRMAIGGIPCALFGPGTIDKTFVCLAIVRKTT